MSSFCFLQFQLMNRFILGAIGHEVRAVPRRSEPEQQFGDFVLRVSDRQMRWFFFLESLKIFKCVLEFSSGFYDVFF